MVLFMQTGDLYPNPREKRNSSGDIQIIKGIHKIMTEVLLVLLC